VEENIDQEKTIDVWTTYEILTNGSRTSKYLYKSFCFWWQDLVTAHGMSIHSDIAL